MGAEVGEERTKRLPSKEIRRMAEWRVEARVEDRGWKSGHEDGN